MKEITASQLKEKIDSKEDIQIIDVREEYEYEIANIGGLLIPLATIMEHADQISRDKTVIVHCKAGMRSAAAIMNLESRFGFTNLYNLKGGILAYAREVDQRLQTY
jgi:rhodanese-related sulfurtransferase